MSHFLADGASYPSPIALDVEEWNRRVDAFDVEGLADDLAAVGCPYYFLTVGQNSGYYCAPNETYDQIVGRSLSRLSRRDLIADLIAALASRGIAMGVYVPSNGPWNDELACGRLEYEAQGKARNAPFQRHWERIIREWSLRWHTGVFAWWVDHVHPWVSEQMYVHDDPPNFASFAACLRAGNPDAIVAFNPGCTTQIKPVAASVEDYSAGELDYFLALCGTRPTDGKDFNKSSRIDGRQVHFLTFMGNWWGQGSPRFPGELVIGYTKHLKQNDAVMTWDVPLTDRGRIPEKFLKQLHALRDLGA